MCVCVCVCVCVCLRRRHTVSTRNTNKEHRIPLANSLRAIQSTFENTLAPIYIKSTDSIGELVNAGRLAGKKGGGGGDMPFPASIFVLVLVCFFQRALSSAASLSFAQRNHIDTVGKFLCT